MSLPRCMMEHCDISLAQILSLVLPTCLLWRQKLPCCHKERPTWQRTEGSLCWQYYMIPLIIGTTQQLARSWGPQPSRPPGAESGQYSVRWETHPSQVSLVLTTADLIATCDWRWNRVPNESHPKSWPTDTVKLIDAVLKHKFLVTCYAAIDN